MAKLTTDTNQQQPIIGQESQTHYPSMQVQKSDKLSQHEKCRQAIPAFIAKDTV